MSTLSLLLHACLLRGLSNKVMFPWSVQYPYSTLNYLNVLHGVFFLPLSSLSHTLSAALADQQTNAAPLDQALSHTAVFFFHVRPCCLPLWCHILFLWVNTLHFTCRTVQMDDRGYACVPMPSAHYLHAPHQTHTHTHTHTDLNGASACYWASGDWLMQDMHTHMRMFVCLGLTTTDCYSLFLCLFKSYHKMS